MEHDYGRPRPAKDLWACLARVDTSLVRQNDSGYAAATESWNRGCTGQRPLAVAYPRSAAAVAGAVRCARAAGVQAVPRSGGSNFMCYSERNGTLTLDLAHLNSVRVHAARKAVTVGGGARLGEVRGRGCLRQGARARDRARPGPGWRGARHRAAAAPRPPPWHAPPSLPALACAPSLRPRTAPQACHHVALPPLPYRP